MISIIIPLYNKSRYIEDCLKSIFIQSVEFEIIIVNDASTDDSLSKIEEIKVEYSNIKLINLIENKGGSFCRNIGINEAQFPYLMFLDADDILSEDCLKDRLIFASENPNANAWVFSMGILNNSLYHSVWISTNNNYLESFLKHQIPWSIMQPLWQTSYFKKHDGFDTSFKRLQDVELHTKALLNGAKFIVSNIKRADCFYRIENDRHSISINDFSENQTLGFIKYYQTFFPLLNKKQQKYLSFSILESLSSLGHSFKTRGLSKHLYKDYACSLISIVEIRSHRTVLKKYLYFNTIFKIHIKGLKAVFKKLLNI